MEACTFSNELHASLIKMLLPDWRGCFIALFALVGVANHSRSIYNRLRLDIKHEQVEIKADEKTTERRKAA
ncbi:MAG: hypothetical protein ACRD3B_12350 [Candidatus Sulfotelmatobacter sp.]